MVLWLDGHKREVSRVEQTKLQLLCPLGFPAHPASEIIISSGQILLFCNSPADAEMAVFNK